MGTVFGADADQLECFAVELRHAADRLAAVQGEVSRDFARSHWDGHDAETFRGQWHYRLSGLLHTAVLANRSAADALVRNAHQQRAASGSDGWTPVTGARSWTGSAVSAPNPLSGLLDTAGVLVNAGGRLNLVGNILEVARDAHGVLPGLFNQHFVYQLIDPIEWVGKSATGLLPDMFRGMERVGPLAIAGLGFDVYGFATAFQRDPFSADTFTHGVDLVFDGAEILAAECPPAALAIGVVHMGFDWFADTDVGQDVMQGVADTTKAVFDTTGDVLGSAADAAGDVISGGLDAVSHLFHW